jgi:hypothetical protein
MMRDNSYVRAQLFSILNRNILSVRECLLGHLIWGVRMLLPTIFVVFEVHFMSQTQCVKKIVVAVLAKNSEQMKMND